MKNFMTFWFKQVILKGEEKLIDYDEKKYGVYVLDTNRMRHFYCIGSIAYA